MAKTHFLEALLPERAAKELGWRSRTRTVGGQNPLWTFLGKIIRDEVRFQKVSIKLGQLKQSIEE